MENPLWKKLQNDPALLKQFNQQQQISSVLDGNTAATSNEVNNGILNTPNESGNTINQNGDICGNTSDGGGGSSNQTYNLNEPHNFTNNSQPSPSIHKKNGSSNNLAGKKIY